MSWIRAGFFSLSIAFVLAAEYGGAGLAGEAPEQGRVELALPRPIASDEALLLQISAGPLPSGAEISVTGSDGELLGTVSPFGVRRGQGSAAYSIPIAQTALRDGRISLRLELREPGAPARAPTQAEVQDLSLEIMKVTN